MSNTVAKNIVIDHEHRSISNLPYCYNHSQPPPPPSPTKPKHGKMNLNRNQASNDINSNISTNDSHPPCLGFECYPSGVLTAVEIVAVLLALCGFLSNGLTLVAVIIANKKNKSNNILIGNLSLASVLYCCLVLPLQAQAFHHRQWVLPVEICLCSAAIRGWLNGVNMMLLSAIALYRFIHVVHPGVFYLWSAVGRIYPIVAVCWMFPGIFVVTPFLGWGSYRFEPLILMCTFNSQASDKSHKITTITLGYVIPCIFICVFYTRIGYVVCKLGARVRRSSSQGMKKSQQESLRVTTMMLLVFLGFFVGITPSFLVNITDPKLDKPMAHIWAPCSAWLLYCLNPIIYTVMDKNFQQAYRQLIGRYFCKGGRFERVEQSQQPSPSSSKRVDEKGEPSVGEECYNVKQKASKSQVTLITSVFLKSTESTNPFTMH